MIVRFGIRQAGFTLLEILVVLIIVGLLASLAVFSFGGNSQQRELKNEVRDLYLLMQTASEQAILNNRELGLQVSSDGYQFLAFVDDPGEWQASEERLFSPGTFPEWLVVTKFIENNDVDLGSDDDEFNPDVIFFSSGEIDAFEFEFTAGKNTDYLHVLASDGMFELEWRKPGDEGEEDL